MKYLELLFYLGEISTMQCIPLPVIWWFLCTCWIVYRQSYIFPDIEIILLEFPQGKLSPGKIYDLDIWFYKLVPHIDRDKLDIINTFNSPFTELYLNLIFIDNLVIIKPSNQLLPYFWSLFFTHFSSYTVCG